MGIEPTTSGIDLPSLYRLSYKVAQRKSGTILDGESPSGLFMGLSSTWIYTSELILCSTICVPSAMRHNIHLWEIVWLFWSCKIFLFTDSIQGTGPDVKRSQEALSDTQKVISKAIDNLSSRNYFQIFVACVMLLFVISPVILPVGEHSPLSLHHVAGKILYLVRIFTTIILSGFTFYLILNRRDEYSAYRSVQQMIGIQLKQISPRKRMKFLTVK